MKIAVHTAFAVLVAVLLVMPGSMSTIGAGPKATSIELSAAFRDYPDDGIRSDIPGKPYVSNSDTPGYPNNVLLQLPAGTLFMRIQQNRRLVFRFAELIREPSLDADGKLYCRGYNQTPLKSYDFTYGSLPSFLQDGASGEPANDFTRISTRGVYAKSGEVWTYTTPFSLTSMGVTTPLVAYVGLSIDFHMDWKDYYFDVMPEYYLWRGQDPMTGIVKVTRDTAKKTWTIEPLPEDDPDARDLANHLADEFRFNTGGPTDPLPYPGFVDPGAPLPFQASLFIWTSSQQGKDGHPGGYCDLGDWRLPFQLTLTEIGK